MTRRSTLWIGSLTRRGACRANGRGNVAGKPPVVGPTARRQNGLGWDKLARLAPLETHDRACFGIRRRRISKQAIGGNVTFDPRLTIGWKRRFAAAAMRAHAAH